MGTYHIGWLVTTWQWAAKLSGTMWQATLNYLLKKKKSCLCQLIIFNIPGKRFSYSKEFPEITLNISRSTSLLTSNLSKGCFSFMIVLQMFSRADSSVLDTALKRRASESQHRFLSHPAKSFLQALVTDTEEFCVLLYQDFRNSYVHMQGR